MSIALHAATQARRLVALTAVGLPSLNESHPMDHDSDSSGHTDNSSLTPSYLYSPTGQRYRCIGNRGLNGKQLLPSKSFPGRSSKTSHFSKTVDRAAWWV